MGSPKDFETMLTFVNLHKVKPVVDSVFPLEKINDAMDKLRDGTQFGKIVIDIRR
jgi:D-arabinose 1-dehydrogenase-like Zn-dependent alcohol dehydrogenase